MTTPPPPIGNFLIDPDIAPPEPNASDPTQQVFRLESDICNATLAEDLFRPPPFRESHRLQRTNRYAFRFGGSNDMMKLLEGTSAEQTDYLIGLFGTSVVVAAFFVWWGVFGLTFKGIGYKRVGFLAGRFVRPSAPKARLDVNNDPSSSSNNSLSSSNGSSTNKENGENDNKKTDESTKNNNKNNTSEEEIVFDLQLAENKQEEEKKSDDDDKEFVVEEKKFEEFDLFQKKADELDDDHDAGPPMKEIRVPDGDSQNDDHGNKNKDNNNNNNPPPEWIEFCQRQETRLFRTRIVLSFSLVCVMTSAVLFCYYGQKYIESSIVSVADGLRHIQKLARGGVIVIDNYIARETIMRQQIQEEAANMNTICAVRNLCQSIDPLPQECDFSIVPDALSDVLQNFFQRVFEAKDYVFDEIMNMRSDLLDLESEIEEYLDRDIEVEWAFWVSFGFVVALSTLCLIILLGIYQAHRGGGGPRFDFVRRNVVLPLFIVFFLVSMIFAIVFVIGAVAASDWCINGPDKKVSYVLEQNRDSIDSVIYKFALYYVNSCPTELAPIRVVDQSNVLKDILEAMNSLFEQIQGFDSLEWEQQCGNSISGLRVLLDSLSASTCVLFLTLEDINRFFWCRQWNPVYEKFMHEAICVNTQEGLSWVTATMFSIAFFCFLAFFLRAGAFDIEDEERYLERVGRCRLCCSRVFCPFNHCGGVVEKADNDDFDDDEWTDENPNNQDYSSMVKTSDTNETPRGVSPLTDSVQPSENTLTISRTKSDDQGMYFM